MWQQRHNGLEPDEKGAHIHLPLSQFRNGFGKSPRYARVLLDTKIQERPNVGTYRAQGHSLPNTSSIKDKKPLESKRPLVQRGL